MGVTVREKTKGSGIYWIFIRHNGIRKSQKIGTKKQADTIADIVRGQLAKNKLGILDKKPDPGPTFNNIAEHWLDLVVKIECRITTYNRYKSMLRMYVNPVIGKSPIKEVTRSQVKSMLRSMVRKGLSRSSVEAAKNCVSGVCEFAIDEDILEINGNPARGAMKNVGCGKKNERKEIDIFLSQEVELILSTVKIYKPSYYYLFLTLFRTGMRLGEILALEWGDIDFNRDVINVRKSWRNGIMSATKTGQSRQVDMSNQLSTKLQTLKQLKKIEALKKGSSQPVAAIFHDKKNGHLSQNSVRNVWKRVLSKCGISHRKVHTTRHTFTSMMLAANIPIAYISKMLGHSSIQMTVDIYGHLLPDRDKSAVNVLDQSSGNGTLLAPYKKETLVTNEDYEGIIDMVAMQGLEPRTTRI